MSTIDTSRTIEITGSPLKMALLLVAGIVMTGAGYWATILKQTDPDTVFLGYLATGFFALCTVVIIWRLFTMRGPVVVITPQGIRDVRVAREFIPWRAVRDISTWSHQGQRMMVLDVDPAVEETLGVLAIIRWSRGINRMIGVNGLAITPTGLSVGYDELLETSAAYLIAARASGV